MQVYQFIENANTYSVPFDWDEEDKNIDYLLDEIVEKFFDENKAVGKAWQPSFFGVVNVQKKLGALGSLVRYDIIVMSKSAVNILYPLIQNSVELLPYETEAGPYYIINVLDKGEYLNRKATDCDRILANGLCAGINKFVFDQNKLIDKHIFRIPDRPTTRFISSEFVEACRRFNLEGIELGNKVKLWDSEVI